MKFWFLAGCGGHWLMFLIRSLKANALEDLSSHTESFHSTEPRAGADACVTHDPTDAQEFFNARALFNVYLNLMKKAKMNFGGIPFETRSITDQFEIMASAAACTLNDSQRLIDLNFDDIFLDKEKFIDECFSILDKYNILYSKNREIAMQALEAYQHTCVDPSNYFNNLDNIWWLGWCLGIEKYLTNTWPLIYSLDQAKEFVSQKVNHYRNFTQDKVIFFNER